MKRTHAMNFEGHQSIIDSDIETQRHLSDKAVDVYAVRQSHTTTPGESRTSPTLESSFQSSDPLYAEVFPSLVAPLPHAYQNPQDAVHRTHHPAASNGGYSRRTITANNQTMRIVGAGGTNAQQVFQRQAHLNPVSHPMAGGAMPVRLNLQHIFSQGDRPYFPMSAGQAVDSESLALKHSKHYRDNNLRSALTRKGA